MRMIALAVLLAMQGACGTPLAHDIARIEPGPAPGFAWPSNLSGETVLFVGAHPDDESGVAPLLAEACLDRGAKCHFVVAAEANSPGCYLSIGVRDFSECSRIRHGEMAASAQLFGGTVEFFGFDDLFYSHNGVGVQRVVDRWAQQAGGRDALVGRFERVLRQQRPALVFTFDPRHGSTCNPDHRAVSRLLLDAVSRLPVHERPAVWLEQSDNISLRSKVVADVNKAGGFISWPDTAAATITYDASRQLATGKQAYDYVRDVRRKHASQYPDEAAGKVTLDPPAEHKLVPLALADGVTDGDYCDPLNLRYPTLDLPEVRKQLGLD